MNQKLKNLLPIFVAIICLVLLATVIYWYSHRDKKVSDTNTPVQKIILDQAVNPTFNVAPYVLEVNWQKDSKDQTIYGKITNGELRGVAVRSKTGKGDDYFIIADSKEINLKEHSFTIKGQ